MKRDSNPYAAPRDANQSEAPSPSVPLARGVRYEAILLVIAWGWWGWLLSDLWHDPIGDPIALLVFASITLTAGVCGHLLYCYVLKWRGTVLLSLLLLPLPVLGMLGVLFGSSEAMFEIVGLPIELVAHQSWTDRITVSLPVFISIAILSCAHPLRPGLFSAMISALGVSLWYGIAILIAASAG